MQTIERPFDVLVVTEFAAVGEDTLGNGSTEVIDLGQPVDVFFDAPGGVVALESYRGMPLGAAIKEIAQQWEEADQERVVVQTADANLRWERIREIYEHPDFPAGDATVEVR